MTPTVITAKPSFASVANNQFASKLLATPNQQAQVHTSTPKFETLKQSGAFVGCQPAGFSNLTKDTVNFGKNKSTKEAKAEHSSSTGFASKILGNNSNFFG